jgi:hypothetical protein
MLLMVFIRATPPQPVPRERKPDRWTTIAVRESTRRMLFEARAALELVEGRSYTMDQVIRKIAGAFALQVQSAKLKAINEMERIARELEEDEHGRGAELRR